MEPDVILLVEDNENDVFMTTRAFRNSQTAVRIEVARDGVEALELLHPSYGGALLRPALVLTDLRMPRMGGLELLERLRADARTRTLPVLVLSGSDDDPDISRAYELGANGYVPKPVSPQEFMAAAHAVGLYWLDLNRRSLPPGSVPAPTPAAPAAPGPVPGSESDSYPAVGQGL